MPATSTDTVAPNEPSRSTLNGKELKIFMVKGTSLYCVRFADGGQLPDELANQKFTTPKEAFLAIDRYLARKEKEQSEKKATKTKKEG